MMDERKRDHLKICNVEEVESGNPGFDEFDILTKSLPELDYTEIDTKVTFLGKKLEFPLILEAMTGGTKKAKRINKAVAKVASEFGIGMGVGSQRAAIEDSSLESTYVVRDVAPDILLIANLGAVQLNYGYSTKECKKAVDMISADALALHLNPLQEVCQPEGDTNFKGLIPKVNKVATKLKVPVIAKEVGMGLDLETAKKLKVDAYDCGGWGGTSWSLVESYRNRSYPEIGITYSQVGIPTAECIVSLSRLNKPLIGSGGVRDGLDAAKAICLGADVAGVSLPVLHAYMDGKEKGLKEYISLFIREFKAAMFITGSLKVKNLAGKIY